MQVFKHILFPTDLSESSRQSLAYLLPMAEACDADLVILHTYRLIGQRESNSMMLKKDLEEQAKSIFDQWKAELLDQYTVEYKFISEIGFIRDRILVVEKKYPADLMVVSERMLPELLGTDMPKRGLPSLDFMPCALMVIPNVLLKTEVALPENGQQQVNGKNGLRRNNENRVNQNGGNGMGAGNEVERH